jgi:hypothetical protein
LPRTERWRRWTPTVRAPIRHMELATTFKNANLTHAKHIGKGRHPVAEHSPKLNTHAPTGNALLSCCVMCVGPIFFFSLLMGESPLFIIRRSVRARTVLCPSCHPAPRNSHVARFNVPVFSHCYVLVSHFSPLSLSLCLSPVAHETLISKQLTANLAVYTNRESDIPSLCESVTTRRSRGTLARSRSRSRGLSSTRSHRACAR